ncbi:MAG: DNA mismatch repair endonuclease MutL [Puniceicoccales bacterium]|jgi:DNA mismatch repair protein MutL|nr:DNA mismatch repair endonuclease MutL [Puniceicoccales bacterium]
MNIHVLPEQIANQIAAGEVIERPANVVKELLENSLDADAKTIDIQFRKGGSSYICVSDDGKGMDEQDAHLCFTRHATSKLKRLEDLYALHSFGFRGEALPSIASISKTTLRTCDNDHLVGTEIELVGGEVRSKNLCTRMRGSTFTVEQLFFNIPVRRKFLKSESTESAHIVNSVRLYALAYPDVHFTLTEDFRQIFSSPTCVSLEERVDEIWPRRACKHWISLKFDKNAVSISGLICPPGYGYAGAQEVYIFLNKRPIASLCLLGIIRECYRTYLPPKTYPAVFLFIRLPEADVDINVHPAKREVRFKNEQILRQYVFEALSTALQAHVKTVESVSVVPQEKEVQGTCNAAVMDKPFGASAPSQWVCSEQEATENAMEGNNLQNVEDFLQLDAKAHHWEIETITEQDGAKEQWNEEKIQQDIVKDSNLSHLTFLSVWQRRYALYENKTYLLFFDCKAACARVCFEKSLSQLQQRTLYLQNLLLPHTFTLSPLQSVSLKRNLGFLNEQKICSLRHLNENQFLLDALPQCIDVNKANLFVENLLLELDNYGKLQDRLTWINDIACLLAKQVFLSELSESRVEYFRQELSHCNNVVTDPEGNLIWHILSVKDLDRLSLRGQKR